MRQLGPQPYPGTLAKMKEWTVLRQADSEDECWICEHPSVFTLGQSAKDIRPRSNPTNIPLIQSDRGGKITYHGRGQIIIYLLLDLRRLSINVKQLVYKSEEAIIQTLAFYGLKCHRLAGKPGVYIKDKKIAALGFKVRSGCSYHGLSINHKMDLLPFSWIDVCGYEGLEVTDLASSGVDITREELIDSFIPSLAKTFGYDKVSIIPTTLGRINN